MTASDIAMVGPTQAGGAGLEQCECLHMPVTSPEGCRPGSGTARHRHTLKQSGLRQHRNPLAPLDAIPRLPSALAMPPRFLVRGGRPLRGTVRPAGNKNAALPILAATVLADGPIELDNIPRIRDVETMLALLVDLGATVEWTGPNAVRVDARPVAAQAARPGALLPDPRVDSARRSAAGAVRHGDAAASRRRRHRPPPGGHPLPRARAPRRIGHGRRPLRARGQGASSGADIFLDEPSVTGTENALMAAVAAKGRTVLRNAACEPHVQDLARALVAMGAEIDGIGSNIYTIEGGRPLGGRQLRHRARSHRDRQLHRPRRRHQRRDHHRAGAAATISAARCSASSGSASARGSRATGSPWTPTRSGASAPTSAATCPSWRTGPGPRSRPT